MTIYRYLSDTTRDYIDSLCEYHDMTIQQLITYLVTKEYGDVIDPTADIFLEADVYSVPTHDELLP